MQIVLDRILSMRAFIVALVAACVQAEKYDWFLGKVQQDDPPPKPKPHPNFTPIKVTVDGEELTKYIASDECTSADNVYTCDENGRGYIINSVPFDKKNPDFWTPELLGNTIEWTTDMSQHECGCFNTFYTV